MDSSKQVDVLGSTFPLPVEVIPMARSQVGRKLVSLGGAPEYREGVVTDNGNVILDVHNFAILNPVEMEKELNKRSRCGNKWYFCLTWGGYCDCWYTRRRKSHRLIKIRKQT